MTARATAGENPQLDKIVERQMRNWEIARAQRLERRTAAPRDVEEFVCISRAVGSGGSEIAAQLGARLGWSVFDRQILQAMAGNDATRQQIYASMDERDMGWLEEVVRPFIGEGLNQNDYFRRLTGVVFSLARQGHAVFLGRAIDLLLPRHRGLRVRIIASIENRVRRHAERLGVSPVEAQRDIESIERERADFVRRHFHVDVNDPTRHDLIINHDRLTMSQIVDLIVTTMQLRQMIPAR
ncbi:MAG: cytidylate kinase-like family protein [Phycisphaerae bacterium]|nr:cytidylate kinase-like family protein [Phycisphaerae bacterium]